MEEQNTSKSSVSKKVNGEKGKGKAPQKKKDS